MSPSPSAAPLAEPLRLPRKRAADRVEQMLDIADRQINQLRAAAISMQAVGDEAKVSRALVYAYFPDQFRVIDAVLARHVAALRAAGIERAAAQGDALERVAAVAAIYFDHAVEHGAALEYVLRDAGVVRQLDGSAIAFRARLLRAIGRALRLELRLPAHEALVFAQLLEVIPSESARLVREGQMRHEEAAEVAARLIRSSIEALRPYRRR